MTWHQDTALPLCEKREAEGWGPWSVKDGVIYAHAPTEAPEGVIALRLNLDDSKPDNDPLRGLPGTHHRGVFTDDQIHSVSLQIAPVDCCTAAWRDCPEETIRDPRFFKIHQQ